MCPPRTQTPSVETAVAYQRTLALTSCRPNPVAERFLRICRDMYPTHFKEIDLASEPCIVCEHHM